MEFRSQETLGIKNDWAKKWWCCLLVAYLLRGDGPAVAQYIYRMAEIANKHHTLRRAANTDAVEGTA